MDISQVEQGIYLVPFGKYRGARLDVLAADTEYCAWLMAQEWLPEQYPAIHAMIEFLGIMPLVRCKKIRQDGEQCVKYAKFGQLCGVHYYHAERHSVPV